MNKRKDGDFVRAVPFLSFHTQNKPWTYTNTHTAKGMFRQFHGSRRKNQHAYVTSLSGQLVIPALRPPEVCSAEFIRGGQIRFRCRSSLKEKGEGEREAELSSV